MHSIKMVAKFRWVNIKYILHEQHKYIVGINKWGMIKIPHRKKSLVWRYLRKEFTKVIPSDKYICKIQANIAFDFRIGDAV